MSLRITEIFHSIQGESNTVGWPTVFVRLTGCPMRCSYCDTAYAFQGGTRMEQHQVISAVKKYDVDHITVTGGEPLAQPACWPLLTELCDRGYQVSLETGGAISIENIDPRVYIVLDVKTPASNEEPKNVYGNFDRLKQTDALKFVICDEEDYQWAKALVSQQSLAQKCSVFFSPSAEQLDATTLADWIIRDQLKVRLQIQLHKVLWNNEAGR